MKAVQVQPFQLALFEDDEGNLIGASYRVESAGPGVDVSQLEFSMEWTIVDDSYPKRVLEDLKRSLVELVDG